MRNNTRILQSPFSQSPPPRSAYAHLGGDKAATLAPPRWKTQKGFTIVELILYMSILSVLLSVLSAIFAMAVDVQLESQSTSAVEQDKNFILARLSYDMLRAGNIIIPATQGAQEPNFQIVIDGVNYTYSKDANENLVVNVSGTEERLNSYDSSISDLSIKRLGNPGKIEDTLKISFTITSKTQRVGVGPESRDFETTLSLRRK